MEQRFDTEVTTSTEGFTTIRIVDTSSSHPTLHVVERSAEGQVVWVGTKACCFPLGQEQLLELLPFLLTFLETGRLMKHASARHPEASE